MNISHASVRNAMPGFIHAQKSGSQPEDLAQDSLAHESRLLNEALTVAWNTPDLRQDKIEAIRAQIASGTYEIDSRQIAESLLRENPGLFEEISD